MGWAESSNGLEPEECGLGNISAHPPNNMTTTTMTASLDCRAHKCRASVMVLVIEDMVVGDRSRRAAPLRVDDGRRAGYTETDRTQARNVDLAWLVTVLGRQAVGFQRVTMARGDVGHTVQGFASGMVVVRVVVRVDAVRAGHLRAEPHRSESVGGRVGTQAGVSPE